MANYPKTRKKEMTVQMPDGWDQTPEVLDPHTIKYTRLYNNSRYGNLRANLYHKRRSNVYSYELMNLDKSYSTGRFEAETLEKAQKLVDLVMDANLVE